MIIAVFGANGHTGRIFVEKALQAGHTVRANVHSAHNFTENNLLSIIPGDATDRTVVAQTVQGADRAVSLIGHSTKSQPGMQVTLMQHLVDLKVKHIISLTGTGVRLPGDIVNPLDILITGVLNHADQKRMSDGRNHVATLQQSSAHWTVIRVMKLSNGPEQSYALTSHGPAKTLVSRLTVCTALLEVIADPLKYDCQAPIVSNA
jgi:NAD(P)H-binding